MLRIKPVRFDLCEVNFPPGIRFNADYKNDESDHIYFQR